MKDGQVSAPPVGRVERALRCRSRLMRRSEILRNANPSGCSRAALTSLRAIGSQTPPSHRQRRFLTGEPPLAFCSPVCGQGDVYDASC